MTIEAVLGMWLEIETERKKKHCRDCYTNGVLNIEKHYYNKKVSLNAKNTYKTFT